MPWAVYSGSVIFLISGNMDNRINLPSMCEDRHPHEMCEDTKPSAHNDACWKTHGSRSKGDLDFNLLYLI